MIPTTDIAAIVGALRPAGCVFAEDEADVLMAAARTPAELAAMVNRRATGVPLEHVVGWAEFCGLRIVVEPGVFVPRVRTELLVAEAVAVARAAAVVRTDAEPATAGRGPATDNARMGSTPVVLDLCCGSGAVGVALAAALDHIELYAADIDPVAVRCARRNVGDSGGHVYEGDLDAPLPPDLRGRVDVLVANTPYVPTGEIRLLPAEARLHEPRVALDGGVDGLDIQRRVAAAAPRWLAPGGSLLVEASERQAPHTVAAFVDAGLIARLVRSEDLEATVVIGTHL